MSTTRVLVTGAAGFVGRRVVAALVEGGSEVRAVEHRWGGRDELVEQIGRGPFDAAIHLGWYADPRDYLTNAPANLASLSDSVALVEHLGVVGCSQLVVAGTCAEYAPSDEPLSEDDAIQPWSVYGAAKASLHLLLDSSLRPAGTAVAWARLFNLTGPGEDPARLFPTVVRALRAGEPVDLSPGEQVRDYLDVDDVAGALVHLAARRVEGAVNVCSGRGETLRSLLEQLADRVGRRELLRFGARPYGPHDALRVVGDAGRLRATGWVPTWDLSAMLDRVAANGVNPAGVPDR